MSNSRAHTSPDKPLRADARRSRDALIAAARIAFDHGGFDLRFDDYARLAGVGVGTLYRHFPNREALAAAVYREEIISLRDQALRLATEMPAHDAFAALLYGFVDNMHAHPGLAGTLAAILADRSGDLAESSAVLREALSVLMDSAAREGTFRDDIGAGTIMVVLHGIGAAHIRGDSHRDAKAAVTLVLDGLRRTSGTGDSPVAPCE